MSSLTVIKVPHIMMGKHGLLIALFLTGNLYSEHWGHLTAQAGHRRTWDSAVCTPAGTQGTVGRAQELRHSLRGHLG